MNRRSFLTEAGRLMVALLFLVATAFAETLTPLAVGPVGVSVSDMDRSVAFFQNVLAFEKIADSEFPRDPDGHFLQLTEP